MTGPRQIRDVIADVPELRRYLRDFSARLEADAFSEHDRIKAAHVCATAPDSPRTELTLQDPA